MNQIILRIQSQFIRVLAVGFLFSKVIPIVIIHVDFNAKNINWELKGEFI